VRRIAQVELAGQVLLDAHAHEVRDVAHVDELERIAGCAGRDHLAALRHAYRPIGEAVGVVARAGDVGRPDDRGLLAEDFLERLLAQRFQTAVRLAGHFLDGWIVELRQVIALIDAMLRKIRVGGNARDEDVLLHMPLEQPGGELHLFRGVGGIVDDGVPVAALERADVAVAIA